MVLVIIITLRIAANVDQTLALGYVLYRCENQTQPCSPATPHPLLAAAWVSPAVGLPSGVCEDADAIPFGLEIVELLCLGDLVMVPGCLLKLGPLRPSPPRPGSASLQAGGLS